MTTRLDVIIDADTRGVVDGLDTAGREFGSMGTIAKTAGVAVAAGLAVAATAAVKLAADAIGAASNLNETLNKSEVIFGKQADEMRKWAEGAAESFGLSQASALSYAASLGDMFSQLGSTRGEAANLSQDVVQLAADLGSFNNLDTADVLDKITAAFRGEYDSLQALIPNINAARVQKEALAETGKTLATELTGAEKASAALAIIMQDGARAAGDFERTSDSLSNQQKILRANFEDVKAEIGQELLPIATKLFNFLNDTGIPVARELGADIKREVGPAVLALADFIRDDLTPALQKTEPQIRDMAKALGDTAEETNELLDALAEMVGYADGEGGRLLGAFIGTHLQLLLSTVRAIVEQLNLAIEALGRLASAIGALPKLPTGGGFLGLLGGSGVSMGTGLGGGGFFDGGGGGAPVVFEHRMTVDLNNGINSDPVAIGEAIREALEREVFATGGVLG